MESFWSEGSVQRGALEGVLFLEFEGSQEVEGEDLMELSESDSSDDCSSSLLKRSSSSSSLPLYSPSCSAS